MKISYNTLKKYIDFDLSVEQLSQQLTDSGLEVESTESFESLKGGLKGIVIGKVLTCSKHPNADKLSLTTVDVGSETVLSIVCGAPNVAAGQTVVVATVGAMLYPSGGEPFEIKKSKIRGEVSEGMICAEDEIGLGQSHAGIIVIEEEIAPGTPAADYFKVEHDTIFEIGLTPNRADAASHIGVARDIQALLSNSTGARLKWPDVSHFRSQNDDLIIEVSVEDSDACIRYSGLSITGVQVKESPQWLKNFLTSIGVKSINNIVDATNFVLHETGQPLHAFDADKITGKKVVVKKSAANTKFVTLDNVERILNGTELMICNANESMCMAGIFGGMGSGVSESTVNVFLESACFNPVDIRKAARLHGLKTDASFRFERGTDPDMTLFALKRAALLIQEIAGGKISSDVMDVYSNPAELCEVHLLYNNLFDMMGTRIETTVVEKIIEGLDIKIVEDYFEGLKLQIPHFKVDVKREIDVIEEVMRIYGYNNIPLPKKLNAAPVSFAGMERFALRDKLSQWLVANGFFEIMTNSLSKSALELNEENKLKTVELENPLSADLNVLRTTMLYTTLEAAQYNYNRKAENIKLFDYGYVYHRDENRFAEQQFLAVLITGKRFYQSRFNYGVDNSIYFLKSIVGNLILNSGITKMTEDYNSTHDHFSTSVVIRQGMKELCRYGQIKKSIARKFDLDEDVFYAELNFDLLAQGLSTRSVKSKEVPRFPEVRRDLSILLDSNVKYEQLEKLAFDTEKKYLKRVNLFDVYEGKNLPANKKSYALSFTLYDEEKTLQEKEIEKVMSKLMESFESKLGVEIRK